MRPRPAASAVAAPDMPEKMSEARTFTCPIPPFSRPTRVRDQSKIRSVTPPSFITRAAKMNRGMAIMTNLTWSWPTNCVVTISTVVTGPGSSRK